MLPQLLQAFATLRRFLTVVGFAGLGLVGLAILYAVVVEGDRADGPGANIGLALLKLALLVNLPIWALWLLPPYTFHRRG